jgi:hypothetical protein
MPVRYAVGQGMGIFTSFPVLSLMHHFIVNCVVGIPTDRYCLVGDDLLFYGTPEEYAKYLSFMKSIGVTVNPGKTIESISATKPTIEFARNFIIEGIRINPIPFGMLYAWNDGKITFETLAWGFVKVMPLALFINIMKQLDITLTYKDNAALGYYIYKNFKIDFEEIYSILLDIGELPHWFTKDNLDKIIKIVSIGNDNLRTQQYINSEFLSTYTSNCIVRHKEEIERNHLIANSITLLAIVDKSVFDMSETISKRLLDTDLIQYDTDLKGGPLLSKRERNFLDLIHQTNKSK